MSQESAKLANVLTEEEVRGIALYNDGNNYEATVIDKLVTSHCTLNLRNAKLVHENDELMAEVFILRAFQKSTDEIIGDYEEKFTKQNEEICRMQDEISNLRGENNHE